MAVDLIGTGVGDAYVAVKYTPSENDIYDLVSWAERNGTKRDRMEWSRALKNCAYGSGKEGAGLAWLLCSDRGSF
jgi:hypothetical protein